MANYTYTERSWGLDLASEGNQICKQRGGRVGHIGGEWGVSRTGSTSLFPDLLLFSDDDFGQILQGWELKLPDTSIEDVELISNAIEKAERLGTNSFVLWNVRHAVLWVRSEAGSFERHRRWDELDDIDSRSKVVGARTRWLKQLDQILLEIEDLFTNGKIRPAGLVGGLGTKGILEALLAHTGSVARQLQKAANQDENIYSEVTRWWLWNKSEYPSSEKDPWVHLAKMVISTWLNKILFAHVLQNTFDAARRIKEIDETKTILDGIEILNDISDQIDFKNILKNHFAEESLSDAAWRNMIDYNGYLSEFRFDSIESNYIHDILASAVETGKRKIAGQYATPSLLASLLVRIGLPTPSSVVIDPCCGTGTIGRSALEFKRSSGISAASATDQVWASDKFSYPIQLAHLSMVDPQHIGGMVKAFRSDIFDLESGKPVTLVDPSTGLDIRVPLPEFDAIVSNFPFVRSEDVQKVNSSVSSVVSQLGSSLKIDPKSDLYAYLPFYCWRFLRVGGQLAFITSNSWMATNWGKSFRNSIRHLYRIKTVVISGAGRWFQNAEVVTTILILEKIDRDKKSVVRSENNVSFASVNKDLSSFSDEADLDELAMRIRVSDSNGSDVITINSVSEEDLGLLDDLGLSWMVNFVSWEWLKTVKEKLIKTQCLFAITRGARPGWDKLFYPSQQHSIEPEFIFPVLMSSRDIRTIDITRMSQAFACELSVQELTAAGKHGALDWIKRFEGETNNVGKPLVEVLGSKTGGVDSWYQMSTSNTARIVTSMNPGNRLFFGLLETESFVNQRLISLSPRSELNVELSAALLNTSISLFFIEGLGFGRGLGALDLSSTRMSDGLHMLNPALLDEDQIEDILLAFAPLREREVLDVFTEMESPDRIHFEDIVYAHFGIGSHASEIRAAVMDLVSRRLSARVSGV